MWTKAIIINGETYLKRDFAFWISILFIFLGGVFLGSYF
jgi:hypothetical protein